MKCLHCKEELPEGANFCFNCGFDLNKKEPGEINRQNINPKVEYGGYLAVGGWLTIIVGAIIAIYISRNANTGFERMDNAIIMTSLAIFVPTVIYSWLYFGLHKIILKIARIEQALGIADEKPIIQASIPPTKDIN